MGLFKKKTDYSYYSSYSSSRRRLKVGRTVIAVIAAVVVILGIIIYFNFNRIQFLMKGYSWSTTSELVSSFDNDEEKELLFGLHLSSCTEEERRKLLCMRGAVNVNSFSKADFLNILQSGGIEAEVTESPSTQHIGVQVLSVKDGQTQQDTQKAVSDYIPAHVECTVTFASEAE